MALMVADPFNRSLTKAGGLTSTSSHIFKSIVICCMSIIMLIEFGRLRSFLTQHRFTDSHRLYRIVTRVLSYQIKWPDNRTLNNICHDFLFTAHRMSGDSEQEGTFSNKARKLEALLAAKLTEFLQSKVVYGMRRVLAAETAHLYQGPSAGIYVPYNNQQAYVVDWL